VATAGGGVTAAALAGSSGSDEPSDAPPAVAAPSLDVESDLAALAASVPPLPPLPVGQAAAPAPPPPPPPPAPAVGQVGELVTPDVMVAGDRPVTPEELERLRELPSVSAVTVVDVGRVDVPGGSTRAMGIDPAAFRPLTPRPTAVSDPLWEAVARGEMALSYDLREEHGDALLPLGGTVPVTGGQSRPLRIGAVADLGLPEVGLIVASDGPGPQLGLVPSAGALLAAPGRDPADLLRDAEEVLDGVEVTQLRPSPPSEPRSFNAAAPGSWRELYQQAAPTCPGLPWEVLAAIGQIESGHGRNLGPSSAGALGPMQFMPASWRAYGLDADGDGRADVMNPVDAVYSAAHYLCVHGGGRGGQSLYDAIFAYNRADWYVRDVLGLAAKYS
jgi:hypothetical protein